ncbi:MAG: hypothetical protein J6Y02_18385 [Pseudobutyrivibrio sp.]|nr:hypothetical protein [Pseudobutyrivibrio sp.]
MARSRDDLQTLLEEVMEGYEVYFQPPDDIHVSYPCLIYERSNEDVDYANNGRYKTMYNYTLTLLDHDADSIFIEKLSELEYCRLVRDFSQNNIYHFVYELYY